MKNNYKNKIELVSCPRGGKNCEKPLSEINRFYMESGNYEQNKEYFQSVEYLKMAFHKTFELQADTCKKCAEMFRGEIINTLEHIRDDLYRSTHGFFRKNRYKGSYFLAEDTLTEFKKYAPAGEVRSIQTVSSEDKKRKISAG